jgi:hypothetical protein
MELTERAPGPGANGYVFLMFLTVMAQDTLYQSARGLRSTYFEQYLFLRL